MPFTLTTTEGVLSQDSIEKAVKTITESMLKWHGLSGSKIMTPNITSMVNILSKDSTFTGGEKSTAIWIEWRTPAFAFNDREIKVGHFKDCTDALFDLAEGKVPRDRIFINVVHAIDGAWNFDGGAVTNEEMDAALSAG